MSVNKNHSAIPDITVQELQTLQQQNADFFLLDVREQSEYDWCHLKGHLIPLGSLLQRLNELDPNQHIIVHCKSGGRSRHAAELLKEHGFNNVDNLQGGILAWIATFGTPARK